MRQHILASVLLGGQAALASSPGALSLLYGHDGAEPWGIPEEEFKARIARPSAVSASFIYAPDISKPFTANASVHTRASYWALGSSIATDISLEHNTKDAKYANNFTTGGVLQLIAPEPLMSNSTLDLVVDDSWSMCLVTWTDYTNVPDNFTYPEKMRSDFGTCGSVLSSACREYIMSPPADADESVKGCSCPDLRKVPACANDTISPFMVGCTATPLNSSSISTLLHNRTYDILSWADASPSDKGNTTSYKNAGSVGWPVLLKFGNSSAVTSSGAGFDQSRLVCALAQAESDWDRFTPNDASSSIRRGMFSSTAALALWAAVLLLVL